MSRGLSEFFSEDLGYTMSSRGIPSKSTSLSNGRQKPTNPSNYKSKLSAALKAADESFLRYNYRYFGTETGIDTPKSVRSIGNVKSVGVSRLHSNAKPLKIYSKDKMGNMKDNYQDVNQSFHVQRSHRDRLYDPPSSSMTLGTSGDFGRRRKGVPDHSSVGFNSASNPSSKSALGSRPRTRERGKRNGLQLNKIRPRSSHRDDFGDNHKGPRGSKLSTSPSKSTTHASESKRKFSIQSFFSNYYASKNQSQYVTAIDGLKADLDHVLDANLPLSGKGSSKRLGLKQSKTRDFGSSNDTSIIQSNSLDEEEFEKRSLQKRVEQFWIKLKVPTADRDYFLGTYADDMEILKAHCDILRKVKVITDQANELIRERESHVDAIRLMLIKTVRPKDFATVMVPRILRVRELTVKLTKKIDDWRKYLWLPHPFLWKSMNYLVKVQSDLDFLGKTNIVRPFLQFFNDTVLFIPISGFEQLQVHSPELRFYKSLAQQFQLPLDSYDDYEEAIKIISAETHARALLKAQKKELITRNAFVPYIKWSLKISSLIEEQEIERDGASTLKSKSSGMSPRFPNNSSQIFAATSISNLDQDQNSSNSKESVKISQTTPKNPLPIITGTSIDPKTSKQFELDCNDTTTTMTNLVVESDAQSGCVKKAGSGYTGGNVQKKLAGRQVKSAQRSRHVGLVERKGVASALPRAGGKRLEIFQSAGDLEAEGKKGQLGEVEKMVADVRLDEEVIKYDTHG
mmetsp:Transcript_64732/g.74374  ORF Transcript_64732/g.74374 Transcript_64732/m.74374 type:complete len:740 (-) Transcript_64732:179-2398(-)